MRKEMLTFFEKFNKLHSKTAGIELNLSKELGWSYFTIKYTQEKLPDEVEFRLLEDSLGTFTGAELTFLSNYRDFKETRTIVVRISQTYRHLVTCWIRDFSSFLVENYKLAAMSAQPVIHGLFSRHKKYSPEEEYFLLINAWRIVRVCEQNVNRIFCVLFRVGRA